MLDAVGAKPKDDPCARAGIIHSSSRAKPSQTVGFELLFYSDEIFTRIDVDNDGELNVHEFMKGCQEDQVVPFSFFLMKPNQVPKSKSKKEFSLFCC